MKKDEIMKILADDISRLEMPPLPDKVRQAIRKQHSSPEGRSEKPPPMPQPHKQYSLRYIFAAVLLLSVISVPVILLLSNRHTTHQTTPDRVPPVSQVTISYTESEPSDTSVTVSEETALTPVRLQQHHGDIALSSKTQTELETLLCSYDQQHTVYEDSLYIYNFNAQGRLVEIMKVKNDTPYPETEPAVTEKEISDKAAAFVKEYFPEWQGQTPKIEGDADCHPAWFVSFAKQHDDLTKEHLILTFDHTGSLLRALLSGVAENIGKISRQQAVQLALQAFSRQKYTLSDDQKASADIIADALTRDGQLYYYICIHLSSENRMSQDFTVLVDPDTGHITPIL